MGNNSHIIGVPQEARKWGDSSTENILDYSEKASEGESDAEVKTGEVRAATADLTKKSRIDIDSDDESEEEDDDSDESGFP
jgi:hypothetical protein